jgi:hypothetical protein
MRNDIKPKLSQRADYTYKYNAQTGRHGWLRLTPAYSIKIVEELIGTSNRPMRIFDPFCGTATTALSASYHGHEGVSIDINPFLVWFGKIKTAHYTPETIIACISASKYAITLLEIGDVEGTPPPPIHNIERWWSEHSLNFLCQLRATIDKVSDIGSQEHSLLLVAFCRTLIALSNAAFNHQSMSFKDGKQLDISLEDMKNLYVENLDFVLVGARQNPKSIANILLGDARNPSAVVKGFVDRVITSPPYVNRMSYIRELRPYMYWLGYLVNARDAGELDWLSVGGTWGIATSRLVDWRPSQICFNSNLLSNALEQIAHEENKNGQLLSNYIKKYFDDMWLHFVNLKDILAHNAELHYIVGNSTFYNVLLPVEQIYAAMLDALDFQSIKYTPIRKRNSKKELIEFDITAVWRG